MKREPLYDFSTALAAPPPMVTPSATRRYALSILTVLLATVVTLVLWPLFERSNVLLLGVAIMASTWYGGFGPGLLAAMLSAALSAYLLVGPLYPLPIAVREDVLRLVAFVAIAGLTSLLAEVRIRSERTLREQWGFCRVTLTSIGDAVIVTNAAGHVTFMNDMAQSLTGWTLEDAFRRPLAEIFQIVNERTRQAVESPVSKVAREGVVVGLANHTVLIAKDRTERPIDDSGAPIRDRGGAVVGVVLVFRDVSERKRGEEERARLFQLEQSARAQAEAANRSKDEFLATISHELRTPLTAILGWIRLVRTMPLDPAMSSRGLETIERNAKAQAQLIDDLLDMSRIVSGRMQLDVRPAELVSVVHAALDSVRPAAEAKGIRLVENLDPTAGPVLGDATRLQQVVWNLLSNAIKFTPKAGRVEVRLERADSNVVITVRDTGQGIAPDFLPHLFERFSQAESRGARTAGLGLGLAIVRHLVELHGGTVVAESGGTDRGATFRVTLPLRAVFARPRDAEDVAPA
jgi:PAS domain S-box-containing protein